MNAIDRTQLNRLKEKAMKTIDTRLERDMRNVVAEVEGLLESVGKEGGDGVRDAQDRVLRVLDSAKAKLGSIESQVRTGARHAVEATDDYVHEQPWQAVGVGALVGLIAGLLIARR